MRDTRPRCVSQVTIKSAIRATPVWVIHSAGHNRSLILLIRGEEHATGSGGRS
jgi:hypothetical protein